MSDIRAGTISDAAGTGPITLTKQSAAKAWVNFNGTGTAAIRESFNVGSITDNGIGDYTANMSSNMSDSNYSASFTTGEVSTSSITNRACCVSVMNVSFEEVVYTQQLVGQELI